MLCTVCWVRAWKKGNTRRTWRWQAKTEKVLITPWIFSWFLFCLLLFSIRWLFVESSSLCSVNFKTASQKCQLQIFSTFSFRLSDSTPTSTFTRNNMLWALQSRSSANSWANSKNWVENEQQRFFPHFSISQHCNSPFNCITMRAKSKQIPSLGVDKFVIFTEKRQNNCRMKTLSQFCLPFDWVRGRLNVMNRHQLDVNVPWTASSRPSILCNFNYTIVTM